MKAFKIANLILLAALSTHCTRKPAPGSEGVESQTSVPTEVSTGSKQVQTPDQAQLESAQAQTAAPISPITQPQAKPEADHISKAEQAPAAPACMTFAFQHQASAKHTPGPDCAHHKNRVNLPEAILDGHHDLNHLCVRVDGVPVVFLREGNSITVGAAPRSRSMISVSACRKGVTCSESCNVPKDELMNELAGESSDAATGWDEDSAIKVNGAIDDEIKRELASLDEEEISKDWAVEGQPTQLPALACASRTGKKSMAVKSNE